MPIVVCATRDTASATSHQFLPLFTLSTIRQAAGRDAMIAFRTALCSGREDKHNTILYYTILYTLYTTLDLTSYLNELYFV